MKKIILLADFLITVSFCILTVSCKEKILPAQVHVCMDTVFSINLFEDGTEKLYKEIFERMDSLERQFSVTISESDVSQLNRNAGSGPVRISKDVLNVLEVSSIVSKISEGAFDITTDPVIRLWGINTENVRVPLNEEIVEALSKVGYERMFFADDGVSWAILENGMSINLGAVAKGYAADMIVEILKIHNVKKAVLDLGGNIYCYGQKDDGRPWTVGIKNPEMPMGNPLLKISSFETSVVTSGIYERFFEQDGKKYHHIFDPKTGFPVENDLASVTVICNISTVADALSTACFVMGKQKSLEKLKQFEKIFGTEIGLVFIHKDGRVEVTENLEGRISVYGAADSREIEFLFSGVEASL